MPGAVGLRWPGAGAPCPTSHPPFPQPPESQLPAAPHTPTPLGGVTEGEAGPLTWSPTWRGLEGVAVGRAPPGLPSPKLGPVPSAGQRAGGAGRAAGRAAHGPGPVTLARRLCAPQCPPRELGAPSAVIRGASQSHAGSPARGSHREAKLLFSINQLVSVHRDDSLRWPALPHFIPLLGIPCGPRGTPRRPFLPTLGGPHTRFALPHPLSLEVGSRSHSALRLTPLTPGLTLAPPLCLLLQPRHPPHLPGCQLPGPAGAVHPPP